MKPPVDPQTDGWIRFWNGVLLVNLIWTAGWTASYFAEIGGCGSDGSECEMAGFASVALLILGEAVLAIPSLVGLMALAVHAADRDLIFERVGSFGSPLWGLLAGLLTIVIWVVLFTLW
jgi:hypothetical protein